MSVSSSTCCSSPYYHVTKLFLGRHNICMPQMPTADQSTDMTKVQLAEPMSFSMIIYKNMGKGLLTGAEVTQRQVGALPKHTPEWMTDHKSGNLELTAQLADTSTVGECLFYVWAHGPWLQGNRHGTRKRKHLQTLDISSLTFKTSSREWEAWDVALSCFCFRNG